MHWGNWGHNRKFPGKLLPQGNGTCQFHWTQKDAPGWLHTERGPLKNGPSHPAPQGRNVGWHSLKWTPSPGESLRCRVSLPEECPHENRAEMGHQLPPLTWQTEATPQEMTDWSRPWEVAQTIPVEEDVDLEYLPPLEPYLQQLLGEEEPSPAGAIVGGSLPPPPMPTLPPPPLPSKDQVQTTRNLPRRCTPSSRCLRHATGWRSWISTTLNCWHTPPSASTSFCCWGMQGLAPRTSVSPNCIIPSPMQGLCSIGLRSCIPQSPANLITWWGLYRNSGGQWSCSSLLQREMSSWPQCHPNGWK